MGRRLGAWKAKGAQLVVWQQPERITFEFGKFFKDKQTNQWKSSKTIFANELRDIGNMFLQAAEWAAKRDCGTGLPLGMELAKTQAESILGRIKERYETNRTVER